MINDKYDHALSVRLQNSIRNAIDNYREWVHSVEGGPKPPSNNEAIRRLLRDALEDHGFYRDPIAKPRKRQSD